MTRSNINALISRLDLAASNGFAKLEKITGLGAGLSSLALPIAGTCPDSSEFVAWTGELARFDQLPLQDRKMLIAKGMRLARQLDGNVSTSPGSFERPSVAAQPSVASKAAQKAADAAAPQRSKSRQSTSQSSAKPSDKPALRAGGKAVASGADYLGRSCSSLKGIGPTLTAHLSDHGIETVEDLLWHTPARYSNAALATTLDAVNHSEGDPVTLRCSVISARVIFARGRRWADVRLQSGEQLLVARWWNAWPGMEAQFPVGAELILSGTLHQRAGKWEINTPDVLWRAGGPEPGIVVHYPKIAGVPGKKLEAACVSALAGVDAVRDELPATVAAATQLPSLADSIRVLHQPPAGMSVQEYELLATGRSLWHVRLAFGELFVLAVAAAVRRKLRCSGVAARCPRLSPANVVEVATGLTPTAGQREAIEAIASDLERNVPMNRLLEGDVGSGKTLVAFAAALQVAKSGKQVALMAPTQVLAEQHARTWQLWGAQAGVKVALLTAATLTAVRSSLTALLAAGAIDIVIGTHSLLSAAVGFHRLGLVIIDEQQRFGVAQRMSLRGKGDDAETSHLLVMTATPIPRTLALTTFGDLDRTTIKELPAGRQPIETKVAKTIAKAADFLAAAIAADNAAYVVCPRIDAGDNRDGFDATAVFALLAAKFPDQVALVHGRLTAEERDEAMRRFADGSRNILVATTVIEVGVDNPNATVMVILAADRFGLSQLHQLRGRVGRGSDASTCVLVPSKEPTSEGHARVNSLVTLRDGFAIAEEDLKLRGPGELFGEQQSGTPKLALSDSEQYVRLLTMARDLAAPVVAQDPSLALPEHQALKSAVTRRLGQVFDSQSG